MRKTTTLAVTLVFSLCLSAQKTKTDPNLPVYGLVEKADLELKACEFDEKAEALVLLDDGLLEYSSATGMELKRRVRIKILNTKGLDWANVHLSYRSDHNHQDIAGLEAQTYNLDAAGNMVVTKLDKASVYQKKLNKKYNEKVFTFPEVRVGSIIEYKYKHWGVGLVDWYFQRSIPVRFSHFTIDFPSDIEVATIPHCSHDYESKTEEKYGRTIHNYSIAKVPAFRDEPFIINEDFYRDRLETKVIAYSVQGLRKNRTANWIEVIKFLMEDEDFGMQVKKNIPRTAELDAALKNITTPYERMNAVYKYVQNNMTWNDYTGIWALDGVKSAWKDKKGTVGEINLILVNLLKDAGLSAHPVLVSTHDNGVVNSGDAGTYDYPGFNQFDKVMAYVEIDNKMYVLDGSQKNTPANLIPADILMTEGLVIEKIETQEWGWKTLWKDNLQAKNVMLLNGTIDETGKLAGEASISSFDYARLSRLGIAKKGKEKFIEKYIAGSNQNVTVDDVRFENLDADSLPLVQKIKFTQPLNSAGAYSYFSANILSGLEKNPFLADNRFSDVFFGCNQSFMLLGNFSIPEGYEFDVLPKNIKMILPDTSIVLSRLAAVEGNRLQTRIQLDFKRPVYPATQYGELQEFYQRLFEVLNEQFVIRRKEKALP
ncbi:MAG TPA: DUF3857 domain-containing protein [Chitinophagaceae bacterium]|nr:DUF3857 domain-containing protein [Chitinophagaceae bacterium]